MAALIAAGTPPFTLSSMATTALNSCAATSHGGAIVRNKTKVSTKMHGNQKLVAASAGQGQSEAGAKAAGEAGPRAGPRA